MTQDILGFIQGAYAHYLEEFSESEDGFFSKRYESFLNLIGNKFIPRAYFSQEAFEKLKEELNIGEGRDEIVLEKLVIQNKAHIKNGSCDANHGIFVIYPRQAYGNDLGLPAGCNFNERISPELELIKVDEVASQINGLARKLGEMVQINNLDPSVSSSGLKIEIGRYNPLISNDRQLSFAGNYPLIQKAGVKKEIKVGNIRAEKGYSILDGKGNIEKYESVRALLPEITYQNKSSRDEHKIIPAELGLQLRGNDIKGYRLTADYALVSGFGLIPIDISCCDINLDSFLKSNFKKA